MSLISILFLRRCLACIYYILLISTEHDKIKLKCQCLAISCIDFIITVNQSNLKTKSNNVISCLSVEFFDVFILKLGSYENF